MHKLNGLQVITWLLLLGNLGGLAKSLFSPDSLASTYNRLPENLTEGLFILPILSIVALAALLLKQKWAFPAIVILSLLVLAIDLYAQVWPHAVAVVVSLTLLSFFYFRK